MFKPLQKEILGAEKKNYFKLFSDMTNLFFLPMHLKTSLEIDQSSYSLSCYRAKNENLEDTENVALNARYKLEYFIDATCLKDTDLAKKFTDTNQIGRSYFTSYVVNPLSDDVFVESKINCGSPCIKNQNFSAYFWNNKVKKKKPICRREQDLIACTKYAELLDSPTVLFLMWLYNYLTNTDICDKLQSIGIKIKHEIQEFSEITGTYNYDIFDLEDTTKQLSGEDMNFLLNHLQESELYVLQDIATCREKVHHEQVKLQEDDDDVSVPFFYNKQSYNEELIESDFDFDPIIITCPKGFVCYNYEDYLYLVFSTKPTKYKVKDDTIMNYTLYKDKKTGELHFYVICNTIPFVIKTYEECNAFEKMLYTDLLNAMNKFLRNKEGETTQENNIFEIEDKYENYWN